METERRQEANDSFRNALRHFCKSVVFGWFQVGHRVQTSSDASELASARQPSERFWVNAGLRDLREPNQSVVASDLKNAGLSIHPCMCNVTTIC